MCISTPFSVPCPYPDRSCVIFYSNSQCLEELKKAHVEGSVEDITHSISVAGILLALHPHHISTYPGNFLQVLS